MASSKALLVTLLLAIAAYVEVQARAPMIVSGGSSGRVKVGDLTVTTGEDGKVTVDGAQVHDEFTGMPSSSFSRVNGLMVIGDAASKAIVQLPEKSNELVVVEDNKCTLNKYRQRKLVSTEAMSTSDCDQVLEEVAGMWSGKFHM